jgi:flagellum-specific ATP synthase
MASIASAARAIRALTPDFRFGSVVAVRGALIEVAGLAGAAQIGSRLEIATESGRVEAEVTGLDHGIAQCMPFCDPQGVASGARADLVAAQFALRPDEGWLGRVIDGLGRAVDGKGSLPSGPLARPVKASPPPAAARGRVGEKIDTGVRALDIFAPLCRGQRLGLFAGSGVGKSVLLSMLTRWTECDVAVIGLIGERGRELQEFVEDDLGPEGLARSVVVVATSDEPALMRRQAAWTTLAVAEHFRDQGLNVLCLMDSVTRFAMAQREIGLATGEPPATKGYTPTVFAELPRLLERAGPGLPGQGSITGLFTVLVDGDDHNEPIADAVRGVLDGHVVMSRRIAERGRYPAIDLLKSVSRTLPRAHTEHENALRLGARSVLSLYSDMEEMVRLGAYKQGASPEVDRAIALAPQIEALLSQGKDTPGTRAESFAALEKILETTSQAEEAES